jgi:hypothetical protein
MVLVQEPGPSRLERGGRECFSAKSPARAVGSYLHILSVGKKSLLFKDKQRSSMSSKGRSPKMTDRELIRLLKTTEDWAGRPFTDAKELSEQAGMSRQGVRQRLEKLVDECEQVKRHKPSRDVIYWFG